MTTILLVDDHKATRDEIRALIEGEQDLRVVAESVTGEIALDRARDHKPDVVIMDILLPGMNGIVTTRRMLAEQPGIRVLALSNHSGDSLVDAVFEAGGLGYVLKRRAFQELIPAIRSVAAGERYVSTSYVEGDRRHPPAIP